MAPDSSSTPSSPNGIVVAPDMGFALVAVPARPIWRLPLHADGNVTKARFSAP